MKEFYLCQSNTKRCGLGFLCACPSFKAIALIFLFITLGLSSYSQTVTLTTKNAPLEKIFEAIRKQTGYEVLVNKDLLKATNPVTVSATNMSLLYFLNTVLRDQPLSYQISNRNILLTRKPPVAREQTSQIGQGPASQERRVMGRVLDENGDPLMGALVRTKSQSARALTEADGRYMIWVTMGDTLLITHLGYQPAQIKALALSLSDVRLETKNVEIEEVVINTGMFERQKESFTGAATTFTGDQLKVVGNNNILQSLKTLDPSFVQIENNLQGSNPNSMPNFEIRGRTSVGISTSDLNDQFNSDPNQPLFILDGFESTLQAIYDLDINRVASVTILKDAASTTLYGSKAANGVVVVQTKPPVPGQLRVSYTTDLSVDIPDLSSYNMMNSAEKVQFEKLSGYYNREPNYQWDWDEVYNRRMAAVARGVNTYWMNEPVRTGFAQRQSVQLSGGNNELLFNAGALYRNQNGAMKGSVRQNWAGNFGLTYRKGKLNITDRFNVSGTKGLESPYGSFSDFVQANPYYEKTSPTGTVNKYLDTTTVYVVNPLYNALLQSFNQSKDFSVNNNLQMILSLSNSFRITGGLNISKNESDKTVFVDPENSSFDGKDIFQRGSYNNTHTTSSSYDGNLMLSYGKVIGKHQININGRSNVSETSSRGLGLSAVGFPYGTNGNPIFAYSYTPYSRPSSTVLKSRSVGFMGSLNYGFDQRYLVDLVYRLDGTSVFGSQKKFRPFASAGLGWNIHRENFLKNVHWIDLLKLRGNIGQSGNENLGQFLSVSTYVYETGMNLFGQLLNMTSLGNPNLEWQSTVQQSYGLDFSLFSSRLSGTLEFYLKTTDPLVVSTSGVLPSSTGLGGDYSINVGKLKTKGWNFNVRYSPIYHVKERIIWSVGVMGGTYHSTYSDFGNKLQTINEQLQNSQGLIRYRDGYSPDDMWAVVSKGIDPATGNELFQQIGGNLTYTYNPADVVKVGNSRPTIEGVINTNFTYKEFTVGANIRYQLGGYVFNSALYNRVENIGVNDIAFNQDKRALYERWQQPGDVTQFKAINLSTNTPMSSRFIQKDNHFAGESFNIGWRKSNGWIRDLKLQTLSFTFYMNNIFRLESIKSERGIDYPFTRSVSFSLNASF